MTTRRRTSQRGFAAMDPQRRKQIARKGGLASHGGSNQYEEDYDEDYRKNYDENDYNEPVGEYEDEGYEEDYQDFDEGESPRRQFQQPRGEYGRYEEGYDDYNSNSNYPRNYAGREEDNYGGAARRSRRGFGGGWNEYENRESYNRGRNENRRSFSSGQNRGRSQQDRSYYSPENSNSRRGFASMDRNEVRRIARKGGRASHGGRR